MVKLNSVEFGSSKEDFEEMVIESITPEEVEEGDELEFEFSIQKNLI